MRIVLTVFVCFLVMLEIGAYFNLKKFFKEHEEQTVEDNLKGLLVRIAFMVIISVAIGVLGIITYVI